MASHLDVHLGDFNAACDINIAAIEADGCWADLRTRHNYYHTYTLHCYNQLVWSAGFSGRSEVAFAAAEAIISTTPVVSDLH